MNSEQVIIGCGELINKWFREEDGTCCLFIKGGKVYCCSAKERPPSWPRHLIFNRWEQKHGLSPGQWQKVGTSLLNQLNREKACQTHQKP